MSTNFSLKEFLGLAYKLQDENPEWRWGQTLFNTLHQLDSILAEEIRGTDVDTYYAAPDSIEEHEFFDWLIQKILE